METAKQFRYWIGAVRYIVPEGTTIVEYDDSTFGFNGYPGRFNTSELESLRREGYLRHVPK